MQMSYQSRKCNNVIRRRPSNNNYILLTISDTVNIISGVIQSSCLGPVLFVLYINSIVKVLPDSVACLLFADDVKIYTVARSDADKVNLVTGRVCVGDNNKAR